MQLSQQSNSLNTNNTELDELLRIFTAVKTFDPSISLDGKFWFTKSKWGTGSTTLERAFDIENKIKTSLNEGDFYAEYARRIRSSFDDGIEIKYPFHIPYRSLNSTGIFDDGRNVFLYFPQGVGLETDNIDHVFGIELISASTEIFKKNILPSIKLFGMENDPGIKHMSENFQETIYLYSVLHEGAHSCGPFRVLPTPLPNMNIGMKAISVLGEMYSDMCVSFANDRYSELLPFIMFMRLFWYGRLDRSPGSVNVTKDYDSWITAYLFKKLEERSAFSFDNEKLLLDWGATLELCREIRAELLELASDALRSPNSREYFNKWMKQSLNQNENGPVYSPELLKLYNFLDERSPILL